MPVREVTSAELAHDLRETVGRVVRRLRAEPGLAVSQMAVLGRIDHAGPQSISDLAAAERMRPQSMAQIVHELEAAGHASRRPDREDRRRVLIDLTPAGRTTLEATRARREGWLAETLESELTTREREQLRRALELLDRIATA